MKQDKSFEEKILNICSGLEHGSETEFEELEGIERALVQQEAGKILSIISQEREQVRKEVIEEIKELYLDCQDRGYPEDFLKLLASLTSNNQKGK